MASMRGPATGAPTAPLSSSTSTSTSSSSASSSHGDGIFSFLPKHAQAGLAAAVFYASCSVGISMLNKAILSSYNFSCYFFMLAAQLCMTLAFCVVTRDYLPVSPSVLPFGLSSLVPATKPNPFNVPQFDKTVYRASVPMSVAYIMNVCLGLLGLQLVNVPMFFAIRRTASAFILLYEFFALGKVADMPVRGAVGIIVAGALVAGSDSLTADLVGYAVTAANNLATAAASVMQKQFSETAKIGGGGANSTFGIMYYQALTALPACIVLGVLRGEVTSLLAFPYLWDKGFWAGFFAASVMGLLLSYSSLLCTTLNSPLATSITGNAKDIILTIAGAIVFPGFKATTSSVGGLVLSFCGSGLYSYISLRKALAAGDKAKTQGRAASGGGGGGGGNSEGGNERSGISGDGGGETKGKDEEDTAPLTPASSSGVNQIDGGVTPSARTTF